MLGVCQHRPESSKTSEAYEKSVVLLHSAKVVVVVVVVSVHHLQP